MKRNKKLQSYTDKDLEKYNNEKFLENLKSMYPEKEEKRNSEKRNKILLASLASFAVLAIIAGVILASPLNNVKNATNTILEKRSIPYKIAYAGDSIQIDHDSSITYLSTDFDETEDFGIKFDSKDELDAWCNKLIEALSSNQSLRTERVNEVFIPYDDQFFENDSLIVVFCHFNKKCSLKNIETQGKNTIISFSEVTEYGYDKTRPMNFHKLVFVEVNKDDVINTTDVKVETTYTGEMSEWLSMLTPILSETEFYDLLYYYSRSTEVYTNARDPERPTGYKRVQYEFPEDYVAEPKTPPILSPITLTKIRKALSDYFFDICYYRFEGGMEEYEEMIYSLPIEYLGTYNGYILFSIDFESHAAWFHHSGIPLIPPSQSTLFYINDNKPIFLWKDN